MTPCLPKILQVNCLQYKLKCLRTKKTMQHPVTVVYLKVMLSAVDTAGLCNADKAA